MMLVQNLKKKGKYHSGQNSLDLVSLDPDRVNKSYLIDSSAGKRSGLISPTERAKLTKKLRNMGGGS